MELVIEDIGSIVEGCRDEGEDEGGARATTGRQGDRAPDSPASEQPTRAREPPEEQQPAAANRRRRRQPLVLSLCRSLDSLTLSLTTD